MKKNTHRKHKKILTLASVVGAYSNTYSKPPTPNIQNFPALSSLSSVEEKDKQIILPVKGRQPTRKSPISSSVEAEANDKQIIKKKGGVVTERHRLNPRLSKYERRNAKKKSTTNSNGTSVRQVAKPLKIKGFRQISYDSQLIADRALAKHGGSVDILRAVLRSIADAHTKHKISLDAKHQMKKLLVNKGIKSVILEIRNALSYHTLYETSGTGRLNLLKR